MSAGVILQFQSDTHSSQFSLKRSKETSYDTFKLSNTVPQQLQRGEKDRFQLQLQLVQYDGHSKLDKTLTAKQFVVDILRSDPAAFLLLALLS
jgi:beta-galactosidase/beta-glucuronidase